MKLIKLTNAEDNKPIYVNVDHIGHFYRVPQKMSYGRVEKDAHTRVGVTTHNNGGFSVAEDVHQILKLIEKADGPVLQKVEKKSKKTVA
jgi:hypothetical protein